MLPGSRCVPVNAQKEQEMNCHLGRLPAALCVETLTFQMVLGVEALCIKCSNILRKEAPKKLFADVTLPGDIQAPLLCSSSKT